jgi:hypothetical protein
MYWILVLILPCSTFLLTWIKMLMYSTTSIQQIWNPAGNKIDKNRCPNRAYILKEAKDNRQISMVLLV